MLNGPCFQFNSDTSCKWFLSVCIYSSFALSDFVGCIVSQLPRNRLQCLFFLFFLFNTYCRIWVYNAKYSWCQKSCCYSLKGPILSKCSQSCRKDKRQNTKSPSAVCVCVSVLKCYIIDALYVDSCSCICSSYYSK